ncbi:TetR/AcrR family transcriptional regulator [Nocardiopsis gilva YIM 90087]|uniref:TetR/AcrR family transcriptional regulator n=1 Tax=Nocardiopsis gilva YIM 90087 TaxID=1235441 RepID=A0A223S2X6_9ACTN|nr:TetR/AcrR family transcriptional regulator [Nocardiopsis gilva]ASU82483.1 TetR/AcrR family transcriptional regulator [Nocardiopsis gilva YIM 90087]
MARRQTDTRAEIRDVALELFAQRGFEKTSLREIAERLDITKAALYYHFPSKTDLLREVVNPLLTEVPAMLDAAEQAPDAGPRRILEDYFDVIARHRVVFMAMLSDLGSLARLDVMPAIFDWRDRLQVLLVGPNAGPADAARVTVAVGGLQDAAVMMGDGPADEIRAAAVAAAYRALHP